MPTRLDGGRILIALGALALLVSLFLDWYESNRFGGGGSAWDAFEIVDMILAALALAALVGVLASGRRDLPAPSGTALAGIALAAFAIVAISLLNEPPAARDTSVAVGGWIALVATTLMALGALLSVARISLTVSVRGREPAGDAAPGAARTRTETHTRVMD